MSNISYLQLRRPFYSAEWYHLCNFGGGHSVQWSKLICAIVVKDILSNIFVKLH